MAGFAHGLQAKWRRLSLTRRVAVLVGLWVLVSALIGGSIASWYVERVAVSREAEAVSQFVRGQVDGTRLEEVLATADASRVAPELGSMMHGLQTVRAIRRIKVYDRRGAIIWSDNPSIIGIAPAEPLLNAALAGAMTHNIEVPQDPEHALDPVFSGNHLMVEIYVPILGRIPNRPVAVVEVYKEAAPLIAALWHIRLLVWGGVLLSGCLALATVLLIVRQSSADLQQAQQELEGDFRGLLGTLEVLADLKDPYAESHTRRVRAMAAALAPEMGISPDEVAAIQTAAGLHDIGKIGVPEAAFTRSGPLMPTDWDRIKGHPDIGADVISDVEQLQPARAIIRHHHERFDGFGYPSKLSGESIPLGSRIIAVADALVAMTSRRPHRGALSAAAALEEIHRQSGRQFDPDVVRALDRLTERGGIVGLMDLQESFKLAPAAT